MSAAATAFDWLYSPISEPSESHRQQAIDHQNQLTKPPGSLGQLEQIAIDLAGLQATAEPSINKVTILLFAADHGVVVEGVSAFPQSVTAAMVQNFAAGGAAISVIARQIGADLSVVNLGTVDPLPNLPGVSDQTIAPGTANLTQQPAMTSEQLAAAFKAGKIQSETATKQGINLLIGGEMGIGNTTAAAAIGCALTQQSPAAMVGPGTGLDSDSIRHKIEVVQRALTLHQDGLDDPLEIMRRLGGFEIAALCAAMISAAQQRIPFLVDGFIATAAAAVAIAIQPATKHWLIFGHTSAEPGHQLLLDHLQATALLNLGMRLGEGSGAAVAVPLLRLACALHNEMATFETALVADAN
ncbi:MAG: nicotinate-nucleotide--dimethylbenzimidazole phosphoribosyltransferase [Immundisolibacteraceae bacterium]|nr:nicotinate-nucleotide--dimethylbenzimidazole phosphoribosyltransferase [Immundisolibacteraceae bacterium]